MISANYIVSGLLAFVGLWFLYIGICTLTSKDYYFRTIERNALRNKRPRDQDIEKVIKEARYVAKATEIYQRYIWGGTWLFFGFVLVGLFLLLILFGESGLKNIFSKILV